MQDVVLFALLRLGVGALIAGLAVGVVVVYRGSGVINIATGALAMVGAYLFWGFYRQQALGFHMSWWTAFILTLVCMAVIGALVDAIAFWPLHNASPLARLASSLGVLLVLQAIIAVGISTQSRDAPNILPGGSVTIFDRAVPIDRLLMAGIAIAVALVIAALYRWTRFGLATRAAAENDVSAMLVGLSAK